MRATSNIFLLLVLVIIFMLAALVWIARSESGSRWLVDTALSQLPFTVEAREVHGTLLDGLTVQQLQIAAPVANIVAEGLRVTWQPAALLAGRIQLRTVQIGTLQIDTVSADTAQEPEPDQLFWLRLPVDVQIDAGHVDMLRVEQAEFAHLDVQFAIGWGRLRVDYADAELAGVQMRLQGLLAGRGTGRLDATGEWRWPGGNLSGAGRFNGNIEQLAVQHVVRLPDLVTVTGQITNLFSEPLLTGVASWERAQIPGSATLQSHAGHLRVRSDFLSVVFTGKTVLRDAAWADMPLALTATADFERMDVHGFRLAAFDGVVTGRGVLDYGKKFSGVLDVTGRELDIAALRPDLPGRLDFLAQVQIDNAADVEITVPELTATLMAQTVTGKASARLVDGELAAVTTALTTGRNRLDANVELRPALRGNVNLEAPDLAGLMPGLSGALSARTTLGGTLAVPRIRMTATGRALEWNTLRAADVALDFDSTGREQLTAHLTAEGLQRAALELGDLQVQLNGTRSDHQLQVDLAGGIADMKLAATGGWNNEVLTERLLNASIRQPDLGTWRLDGAPRLRVATDQATIDAHCWQRKTARLCVGDSRRSATATETSLELSRFPLATITPWLPAGLTIEGNADASLTARSAGAGWQGTLRWQQQATDVTWLLDGDPLTTRLQSVDIALDSGAAGVTLTAGVRGADDLALDVAAGLAAPADPDSALSGRITGQLPDITVLRPWLFRYVDAGDMAGRLSLDVALDGTPRRPLFNGGFDLQDGLLQLPDAGITLTDINLRAASAGDDVLTLNGGFRSGGGVGSIGGELGLSAAGQLQGELRVTGKDLQTVQLPELNLYSSPELTMRIEADGIAIDGLVAIPKALAQLRSLPASAVEKSPDVIVHEIERAVAAPGEEKQVSVDVELVLGDDVQFRGFGLESGLDGSLRLRQQSGGVLRGTGTVQVRNGFLMGYGKELRVDNGTLNFTGPLDDPGVNVQVSRNSIYEGRQYTVGLRLTGTARNVITTPFSSPAMSERDVLAFLLLDRPASTSGEDTDLSGALVALGLGTMLPGDSDDSVIGSIGLDEIGFEGSELEQTAVVAGKRITDDLYIRYVFGLFGDAGSFRIRYRLGRGFSFESSTGVNQALDLIYVVEKD